MRYGRNETVQRSENFHAKQCKLCKGPHNISRENNVNYEAVKFINLGAANNRNSTIKYNNI